MAMNAAFGQQTGNNPKGCGRKFNGCIRITLIYITINTEWTENNEPEK